MSFPFLIAGEKKDIVEAVKVNKLAELLDLDNDMISQLINIERKVKKMRKEYQENEDELVENLEKAIEEKNYEKTDDIIEKLDKLEREHLDESLKLRRDYAKKLSKEKRAKYILYEVKFKSTLKNKIMEKIK
jgi:plasmid maintenance system antidote protein VapI